MASHIATEEWQSFELRMRRRRAERLVVRAEAALENGSYQEAGDALNEARSLYPSLASLDGVQTKISRALERSTKPPIAVRVRRALAVAAGLTILAGSGAIGWRTVRSQPAVVTERPAPPPASPAAIPASQPRAAAPLAPTPGLPPNPAVGSSIRVETKQVPPVVISGATREEHETATAPLAPRTVSASATTPGPRVAPPDAHPPIVGTTGPTTASLQVDSPLPSTSADVGAIAALGKETSLPAPDPPVERATRIKESSNAVSDTLPAPADHRTDPTPAAPAPEATVPAPAAPDDAALVRGILDKYADAYTRLDADAAKAVWPTVNRAALSRAFSGLNEQRIAFNDCSVNVRSSEARATCSGSTTWEPKIGGGPRTDVRRWAFDLEKSADGWIIRDARVQNR